MYSLLEYYHLALSLDLSSNVLEMVIAIGNFSKLM